MTTDLVDRAPAGPPRGTDFGRALGLLTVVPVRASWAATRGPRVAAWFPWVGCLLGALVAMPLWALQGALPDRSLWIAVLGAPLTVTTLALLTRAIHWDGLADVADAWWGGQDAPRRLEIMADSATGAFGVTAVVLVAALEMASLAVIIANGPIAAIVWALTASRMAATFGAWLGAPARPGGLGAAVTGRPTLGAMMVGAGGLAVGAVALVPAGSWPFAVLVGVGVVAGLAVPHLAASRMGGVTGDVLGASVLATETLVLLAGAIVAIVGMS